MLKLPAREVEDLNGSLVGLAESMYETMYEAVGLGLAAPQIGIQRRIFTYDVGEGPHVIVNPEIVESSGEWVYNEGCLSVPGVNFEIVRPKLVTLRGLGLDGNEVEIEADEVLARLFQHEMIAARRRCASSSSARRRTRSCRSEHSSRRGTTSRWSSPSPTAGAAAAATPTRAP